MRDQSPVPIQAVNRAYAATKTGAYIAIALILLSTACRSQAPPATEHPQPIEQQTSTAPDPKLATTGQPQTTPTETIPRSTVADRAITVISVPRHGLDLPTFGAESAREMERQEGIHATTRTIDANLRSDGLPVSIVDYEATPGHRDASTATNRDTPPRQGRQYAMAHPDGERFVVITCMADADLQHCDDFAQHYNLDEAP